MIGEAPKSPHTGLPGWETIAEEELLTRYAALVPEGTLIVEIGGEWGRSAGAFARGAKEGVEIVTVDMFPGELLQQHRANLAEAGVLRTVQHRGDSHAQITADHLMRVQQGQAIMLLFIDGDHSYEGVVMDIAVWARYVPVGGMVIFHDVAQETNKTPHYLHFEVSKAITDWVNSQADFAPVEQVDSIAVFKRVGQSGDIQAKNEAYQEQFNYPVNNDLAGYAEIEPLPGSEGEFGGLDQYIIPGATQDVPAQDDSETGLSSTSDEPSAIEKPKKSRKSKS